MSFVLAHISDVHLGPLPHVSRSELMSKRITGYINWKRNRAGSMTTDILDQLLDAMRRKKPDHIAITGDLTNLALDAEITGARIWLEALGEARDVSAIPGNHDAYVRGALAKAVAAWSKFMTSDESGIATTRSGFPYLRKRGDIAIIGVNSAVATAPFLASGIFSGKQAKGLARALDMAADENLFRVVLIHHPPVRHAATPQKRLYGINLFQKVIRKHGAEMVLHGHTHVPQRNFIYGPDELRVPVIGVPAAGSSPGGSKPAAAFNLFEITGGPGSWRCRLEEHSVTGRAGKTAITDSREYGSGEAPAMQEVSG